MQTVAEIVHKEVEDSIDFLFNKIEQDSIKPYIPEGLTRSQFGQHLTGYALTYPQHPFITEAQIKEICLTHDLKFGDMFSFTGEIPEKNKQEIKNYSSPEVDFDFRVPTWMDVERYLMENFRGSASMTSNTGRYGETILELSGGIPTLPDTSKFLLPFGKNLAIFYDQSKVQLASHDIEVGGCGTSPTCSTTHKFDNCFYVIIQTEDFMSFKIPLEPSWITFEIASFREDFSPRGTSLQIERNEDEFFFRSSVFFQLRSTLSLSRILDRIAQEVSYKKIKPEFKVVAPGTLFNTSALKEVDGYRYKLDELAMTKPSVFVNDPIILDPVEGGYLVVTKWAEEASLIENPNSN